MKGWRARIGVMLPSINSVLEAEFTEIRLDGITFHFSRMPIIIGDPFNRLNEMRRSIPYCLESLHNVSDVLAFACTSGSFVLGVENENLLVQEMINSTNKKVITTTRASMDALKKFKAKKVAVITPYHDVINEKLKEYMQASGFDVSIKKINTCGFNGVGDFPEKLLYRSVKSFNISNDIDAVFISCTNLATWSVIQSIENDIGKPVITANQATFWSLLRSVHCEDKVPDSGELLNKY